MLVKIYNLPHMNSSIAYATFIKNGKKERFISRTQPNREKAIDNLFFKIREANLDPFKPTSFNPILY